MSVSVCVRVCECMCVCVEGEQEWSGDGKKQTPFPQLHVVPNAPAQPCALLALWDFRQVCFWITRGADRI